MPEPPLFRFALVSDSHLTEPETAGLLAAAIRSINDQRPDFALFAGDMMDIGTEAQYRVFQDCLGELRVPYQTLPGNHDLGNAGQAERYRQTFGDLNSAWQVAGHACLALDTTNTDPDPENWHGLVEPPASEWLRETLRRIPRDQPLVLFTHHGLVGRREDLSCDVANAAEVLDLFRGRRLVAGFAGHAHRLTLNYWEGVPFLTVPALSVTRASHGTPPGFLLVDVFVAGIRARLEIAGVLRNA